VVTFATRDLALSVSRSSSDVQRSLGSGVLAFPMTPFAEGGALERARLASHIEYLIGHEPAALIVAAGGAEFFSLTPEERRTVAATEVSVAGGRLPVIAGVGYGAAIAVPMAQGAEAAGADGVLVLPPYLVAPEKGGLLEHISTICRAVTIAVIPYHRDDTTYDDNCPVRAVEAHSNLIALKDEVGDLLLALRLRVSGRGVGPVRLPLVDMTAQEDAELRRILGAALDGKPN